MKTLVKLTALCAIVAILPACAGPDGKITNHFTGQLTPAGQAALNAAPGLLLADAQIAEGIYGTRQSPQTQQMIQAGFNTAGVIIQAYKGQPVPASAINTGVPSVDTAVVKNLTGANATQADANAAFAAAAPSTQAAIPNAYGGLGANLPSASK